MTKPLALGAATLSAVCLWGIPAPAAAQAVVDSTQVVPSLRTTWNLPVSGAVLAVGFMAMETDDEIRAWFQGGIQRNPFARSVAGLASPMGSAELVVGIAGAALLGKAFGQERVADISWHAFESIMAAAVITSLGKGFAGRQRPGHQPEWTWNPGRGFVNTSFRSFPSGHTSQAFALATALASELRHHDVWGARWIGPSLFGAAGLTGVSRLFDDRHWSSDVIIGALVGSLTAQAVTSRNHLERAAPVFGAAEGGGLALGVRWAVGN